MMPNLTQKSMRIRHDHHCAAADIKWVPADEVMSMQTAGINARTISRKVDAGRRDEVTEAVKQAQNKTDAALADYQSQYPKKLFFGYHWDSSKAAKLGLEIAWSDDKFTYFKGSKFSHFTKSTRTASRA